MSADETKPANPVEPEGQAEPASKRAGTSQPADSPKPPPTGRPGNQKGRRLLFWAFGALISAAVIVWGIPSVVSAFSTVSTDDAYIEGHVTFVAARVPGQVARVAVDDNNRVHKGDLLVELDKKPYEVQVELKKAAVETAKADLMAAKASVQAIIAQTRSERWKHPPEPC